MLKVKELLNQCPILQRSTEKNYKKHKTVRFNDGRRTTKIIGGGKKFGRGGKNPPGGGKKVAIKKKQKKAVVKKGRAQHLASFRHCSVMS